MDPRRRRLLFGVAGVGGVLAGCADGGLSAPATPPPATFEIRAAGPEAVELRYTGIGGQDPAYFRVVLEDAGAADGVYNLADVTGDDRWTDEDRYVLNQSTLGTAEPLPVGELTVELQYDDGEWRTLVRTRPGV